jgi:hypothetical protein
MTNVTKQFEQHNDNELDFLTNPEKDFWINNTLHGGKNVII